MTGSGCVRKGQQLECQTLSK